MSLTKLAQDLKATGNALAYERSARFTGATVLRTVTADESGLGYDLEMLYFQVEVMPGDNVWVSEDDLDELEDEDMKQYL